MLWLFQFQLEFNTRNQITWKSSKANAWLLLISVWCDRLQTNVKSWECKCNFADSKPSISVVPCLESVAFLPLSFFSKTLSQKYCFHIFRIFNQFSMWSTLSYYMLPRFFAFRLELTDNWLFLFIDYVQRTILSEQFLPFMQCVSSKALLCVHCYH